MTNVNTLAIISFIENIIKGNQFIALKSYKSGTTNKKCLRASVSNYNLSLGASYQNAKQRSIEVLGNAQFEDNSWKYIETEEKFHEIVSTVVKQIQNPNKAMSKGQFDAYDRYFDGKVKIHKETGKIFIFAKENYKEVIVKGEYAKTKSRLSTLQKNEVKKFYNLPHTKFRNFSFKEVDVVKIGGETIEF